jgi:hypothetical protein
MAELEKGPLLEDGASQTQDQIVAQAPMGVILPQEEQTVACMPHLLDADMILSQ